ncbi:hypothetical protein ABJI51_08450 [Amycolatopsis sp. NEAU-NG30]|uniref:Uncharacterized protein n=1 Tax=Amycolatopsis melonis TaxID=3156488 RepID=A0ABV0L9W3_9PSEU
MNRIEAAASALPAPLEIVVEERPVACFAAAAQYVENVRRAMATHQRHVDGGTGNGFADDRRLGGLAANRETLSATALLALRA